MITTLQLYICNVFCSHFQYVPILSMCSHFQCVFLGKSLQRDAWRTRRRLLIDLLSITENMGEVPSYVKEVVVVED
jgi:hypothetical protein